MSIAKTRIPLRGEIWFTNTTGGPVVIVSTDARNRHERADTVLVIPLSESSERRSPVHISLAASETGLAGEMVARADDIAVVLKADLVEPMMGLRRLNDKRICELAAKVKMAMGCVG